MRIGARVKGREVLLVWVKGSEPYLSVSGTAFTRAVRLSGIGVTQEKRNFLLPGREDLVLDDSNSTRRSGYAIFLDEIPKELPSDFHVCKLH